MRTASIEVSDRIVQIALIAAPQVAWLAVPSLPGRRRRARPRGQPSPPVARIGAMGLARIGWLLTVLACLVAVLILLVQGYFGYAGVTFAVALSAAINVV
jgi:hypothetical protein